MVTSTFEYVPGLPVYKSSDLVNWELIGHVLNQENGFDLTGYKDSDGIYAPTIRYHNGTFYVITTLIHRLKGRRPLCKNILITTTNPEMGWDKPVVITDTNTRWNIDPSLFFDDDGKCYFHATMKTVDYPNPYLAYNQLCVQELDLTSKKLVGTHAFIGDGAMKNAIAPEGPHLYKKDGWYYFLIAEGGTGSGHAVTMSRSKNIFGPYQQYEFNPVATHRHLGNTVDIRNVGHAKLIEDFSGNFWMFCLAQRFKNELSIVGRETFLTPVIWPKNEFPIVNPPYGTISYQLPTNLQPIANTHRAGNFFTDFNASIAKEWCYIRQFPTHNRIANSMIELPFKPDTFETYSLPNFMGIRVSEPEFEASTLLSVTKPLPNHQAGLVLRRTSDNFVFFGTKGNKLIIQEKDYTYRKETVVATLPHQSNIELFVWADGSNIYFKYTQNGKAYKVENVAPLKILNAYGFTGALAGLYATSNGKPSKGSAYFDYFRYSEL